jgi:hypothetical protein
VRGAPKPSEEGPSWRVSLIAVLVIVAVVAPTLLYLSRLPGPTSPPSVIRASWVAGAQVAVTPTTFWSLSAQTANATGWVSDPSLGAFVNRTPFTWFRYGPGTDECNVSSNVGYNDSGVASVCGLSLPAFASWCVLRGAACHSIVGLPGENNNSAEDAVIAAWIVHGLGFQPDYWAIGNEPLAWTHYGIPWVDWRAADNSTPTAVAYAVDVRNAVLAVRAVDPAAQFVGVEAASPGQTSLLATVARIDEGLVQAVAYHSYPNAGTSDPSLAQYYGALAGPGNLSTTYRAVRTAVNDACLSCDGLRVFVNEYNSGPTAGHGPGSSGSIYSQTYANAVFLAASTVQALVANVSQLTIFTLQAAAGPSPSTSGSSPFGLVTEDGVPTPAAVLYEALLSHVASGGVWADRLAPDPPGAWLVRTMNGTWGSLLVVNAAPSTQLVLNVSGLLPNGTSVESWNWSPTLAGPVTAFGPLQGAPTISAQGILLIDWRIAPAGTLSGAARADPSPE